MKNLIIIPSLFLSIVVCFTACSGNESKSKTEQLAKDEMYTCSMHNEVMSNNKGVCPKCNMNLEKKKMTPEQEKMMKEGTYTKAK